MPPTSTPSDDGSNDVPRRAPPAVRALEAVILAGGKGERLGAAAGGKPKALVSVLGHPLAAYQIGLLVRAGVGRVIISCAFGQSSFFVSDLSNAGVEIVCAEEPEPLGRGGGLRFASGFRAERGPVLALNGDELLAIDLTRVIEHHRSRSPAATIVVAPLQSSFGVVDVNDDDLVTGFQEAPKLPYWVNAGLYVLDEEAIRRLPEQGDHERSTFPELAAEGKLVAFRHDGPWLTVNTPKELRRAEEQARAHPDWFPLPEK
jgi:NDP-sugar pyrophosphorylase family protein